MKTSLVIKKQASVGRFVLILMFVNVFFFGSVHSILGEGVNTGTTDPAPSTLFGSDIIVDGLSQKERAAQIDNFFDSIDSPLVGYGMKFVTEADKYEGAIDWRLTAAISTMETSGAKNLCKNPKGAYNPFGFGSCKIGFKSFDQAIEIVTQHVAGEHPNTSEHYEGKTTEKILNAYNPESIRPGYARMVMRIMDKIAKQPTVRIDNRLAINK